jgi:Flp pilus assembly protein TadD
LKCRGELSPPAREPAPREPAQTDDLGRLVLDRFPFPVAYGYRWMIEPETASHAVECSFYTYTATLRLAALVFLSQFLGDETQNPKAAKAVQRLQTPTLESWFTALTTLAKRLFPPPDKGQSYPPFSAGGPLSPGLVAAARALPKLALDGVGLHEALRNLRNDRAHGAPWDEAECGQRLPGLRRLVEAALENFACLAEVQLLRRSPGGMVRLMGASESFSEEAIPDLGLEDLFEDSETVLLGPAGDRLPLYPLFLGAEPVQEGYTEPLLTFDGHGKKSAVYIGVRRRTERHDTLGRYQDLLRAKNIDPRFTKADLAPWNVARWASETSLGTVDVLRGVKYFPAFYEERRGGSTESAAGAQGEEVEGETEVPGVDDAVRRWLDGGSPAALILAAEAGTGKTSLLCRLTEDLLGDGEGTAEERPEAEESASTDCVLLLIGAGVRGRATLFERIRDGLGFTDDIARGGPARFDELLDAWCVKSDQEDLAYHRRRLILLVDALNEAEDPKKLFEELSDLAATATAYNQRLGRGFVRLLVSVRAERIETLLDRWNAQSDTPFLQHPQNFAHFPDERGKEVPYLPLRRFTTEEAARAYGRAGASLAEPCPAIWTALGPETQDLLRHPLMVLLFHQAFAGNPVPPVVAAADAVWGAWLDRTFHPDEGGQALEEFALDLADACIDGGHAVVPPELVGKWRTLWQAEQGNDPVRIAAGVDPLERLAEAGFLREAESGGLDWVSDSLAEQVFYRALRRRDPGLGEESLGTWVALAPTGRLDGALVHAGAACWRAARPVALSALLDARWGRGRRLVGRVLAQAAPRGVAGEVGKKAEAFGRDLGELAASCAVEGATSQADRLKDALLWDVAEALEDRWGAGPARRQALLVALGIAQKLAALEPDNTSYLRDLSVSYNKMGGMDERRDPAKAREWYEKDLGIAEKLAALEPDNTSYLRDLSISYERMGGMDERRDPAKAREWYEKALGIAEKLAALEPDNTQYARDLGISYRKLGDVTRVEASGEARDWYARAVEVGRRLARGDDSNLQFLKDLAFYCQSLGSHLEATDLNEAFHWWSEAKDAVARLAELDPTAEHRQDLTRYLLQLARVETPSSPQRAWERYEQVLEVRQALAEGNPEDPATRGLVASVLSMMAEWLLGQGRADEERAYSLRADEAMGRAVCLKPDDPDMQYGLACTRARLGQTAEALTALARSVELGNTDADHAAQDADLRSLRGLPEFATILEQMQSS